MSNKVLNAGTKPETLRQAKSFATVRNFYAGLGLCNRCAAQIAYGHQNGFTGLHAPCADCQPVVDTFPLDAVGPWRKCGRPSNAGRRVGPSMDTTGSPRRRDQATVGVLHPKCGKRFSGSGNVGHCGVCCETFVGLGAFDAHLSRLENGSYMHYIAPLNPLWWQDARGYWHHGQRRPEDQIAELFTKEHAND